MRLTPFLMFTGQAQAAMDFYLSLFPEARITEIERYGPAGPGAEGTVLKARFELGGHSLLCIDSPPVHAFGFTPSISLFIDCDDEAQLRRLFDGLGEGGQALMPVDAYPFSRLYGWVQDRFGVSWQLNLP